MDAILWLLAVIMAFLFAYIMQFQGATLSMGRELFLGKKWTDFDADFTAATLAMGREISEKLEAIRLLEDEGLLPDNAAGLVNTGSPTGFQDAITPSWLPKFSLVVNLGCGAVLGLIWWHLGWMSALGGAAVIWFGGRIAKLVLPKPTGTHYKRLIIGDMHSRYANYIRDGDTLRADAMKYLLAKAGVNVDSMVDVMRGGTDGPDAS